MATIKDIAKRVGVSDATVSRAFTGSAYVSPQLKEQIFKVAEELNYKPNALAVGLRTNKTKIIALIVPDISNSIYIELVKCIEMYCSNDGYSVILCNTDEDIIKEKEHLNMLGSGLIDGAILVPCIRSNAQEEYIDNIKIKNLVLFNRNIENSKFDIVTSDHYQGVYMAMEHFKKIGYKRIGALIGEIRTSVAKERYQAYMDAVKNMGFDMDDELIKYGSFSFETGYRSSLQMIQAEQPPDAILIFNNALCKGCLMALRECGRRIPEDIALICTDEIENWELIQPKLTFTKQSLCEMSRKAYDILIYKINNNEEKSDRQHKVLFPVQLIINESCGYKMRLYKA